MTTTLWAHLAFGPLLLLIAIWFWKFPPAEINAIYGYRTPRSMASRGAWDFANRLSSRLFIWISLLTITCQVITILTMSATNSLIVSGSFFILQILIMIPIVESKLRQQFPN